MATQDIREPATVGADIGRMKRYRPDADATELYQELATAHVAKKAREIIAKFPRPSEAQIQAIAEILRGSQR